MKSVDPDHQQHELDQNGSHFYVLNGSGVDKRAGTKVKFSQRSVTFFYDGDETTSETFRPLREALQAFVPFYDNYIKAQTDLLAQIRVEHQRK